MRFGSFVAMRRTLTIGLAAAILAAGVGCGGDDSDPQADAVSDAYVTYIDAVKRGDGKAACDLLTPAFQRRAGASIAVGTRADLKDATCEEAIARGSLPQLQQVEPNLEQIEINGDRASGFDPGEGVIGPQEVFFESLDGDWKISKTVFFRAQPSG